jgi:hypothetical protein
VLPIEAPAYYLEVGSYIVVLACGGQVLRLCDLPSERVRWLYFFETSDESLNLRDHYALIADVLHLTPSLTGGIAALFPIEW